ncbi:hypothetical protein H5P92_004445 [Salmonella enterica]|nr:hypothetical protein [Salmonella enterica]
MNIVVNEAQFERALIFVGQIMREFPDRNGKQIYNLVKASGYLIDDHHLNKAIGCAMLLKYGKLY